MASNLMGMAFVPYYKHLMELLETNEELKKTSKGKCQNALLNTLLWLISASV